MSDMTARAITVEARAGSIDTALGLPSRAAQPLPMSEWKRIVADLVASDPGRPLRLVHFGAANLITGYRLYYMLQFAKAAGVRHLSLLTDGGFWIDEAGEWLIETRVDDIVLIAPNGELGAELAHRVDVVKRRGLREPAIRVRPSGPGALE